MIWNKIGFGTWPLSGDKNGAISYGKTNDDESKAALLAAYHHGVNVYDTSDFYGFGHVESLIGEVLSPYRNKITIITKGGMISNEGGQNFSPSHLLTSLTKSLTRLKTDYVDVYMLHSPNLSILEDNRVMDILKFLKEGGLAKEYGISLISPNDGDIAIQTYGFKIIEVNYNILDMRAQQNGLFDICNRMGTKVICRTPLAQGLLSGKFQFTDDKADKRQAWSPEKIQKQTNLYKKMLMALDPNNFTDAQNCLRFCLTNRYINVIIPGMKTKNEVIENISATFLPLLTFNEQQKIMKIYQEETL